MRRADLRALPAAVLALAACVLASCGTPAGSDSPAPGTAFPGEILRAESAEVEVAGYAGAFAAEPLVVAFPAEVLLVAPATLQTLRETTGLAFLPDRGPRVVLVDGTGVPPEGRVDLRVVDGLRRPEIRVRAASVAAGEFVVERDLPSLLVEASVLGAAGERVPPGWVREGLALHLGGTLDRRVLHAALAHPEVPAERLDVAALEPGFRAAALARIAVGERPFERYLARRLAGADEESSLREVGVEREEFLDAAAATERDRRLRAIGDDPRTAAVRAARAALLRGELDRAESLLGSSPAPSAGPVEAEGRLVAAEVALARGEPGAARTQVEQALAEPGALHRLRDARWVLVHTADVFGAWDAAARRAVAFARSFADDPRTADAAAILRLDAATLRDAAGGDPGTRAAAAASLGRGGARPRPEAAEVLRPLLTDGQATVRRAAATAFGVVGGTGDAADLDVACADADPSVRAAAIEALARIDRPRAEARAAHLAEDPSPEVRAAAERVRAGRVEPSPPPAPAK